jgi:hypothetical protein
MRDYNVALALKHYPDVASRFMERYAVRSKEHPREEPRIHKKGSIEQVFRKGEANTEDLIFAATLGKALKDEVSLHPAHSEAQRKAQNLLINFYRWFKDETQFPKMRAIRALIFPDAEMHIYEAQWAAYQNRKLNKSPALINKDLIFGQFLSAIL